MKRLRKSKSGIVPRALKIWFLIHFAADILFALPLMIAPRVILPALGWKVVDPLASRLVAAALLGIGVESLLAVKSPASTFIGMLNLKIIWSTAAIVGIAISLAVAGSQSPRIAWGVAGIFLLFDLVWMYWRRRIDE